jgi:hypothetical protein
VGGAVYFLPQAPGGDDQQFVKLQLDDHVVAVQGAASASLVISGSPSVGRKGIARSAPSFERA